MKWLLLIGGVLAALVVIMIVIGAMLPQAHVASRSAKFSKPPAELFAAVEKLTSENKQVPFDVVERDEPVKLVTRIRPGQSFGGTWTYELAADGTLTITERGEVYNPLFRFLSKYAFGHTAGLEAYLQQLSARLG